MASDGEKDERPIDRALRWAKVRGWNQSEFAKRMDVVAQHITNWKDRGMPPEHDKKAAKVLGHTVDELLGSKVNGTAAGQALWPFDVSYADFDTLEPEQKIEIGEIVEDRVARFKAKNGPKRRRKSGSA